jgi:glycine/D-amino acid oxidase-like deaminating enzyme
MSDRYDIAVVGAGVIGCLTAEELLRRAPGARVAVLDRDAAGQGASRRSAGLHFPRGSSARVREMARQSQDHYRRLVAADPAVPIRSLPMWVVAPAAQGAAVAETYLPEARLTGTGELAPADVVLPPGHLAWRGEGCQFADVPALVQRIAAGLRERADLREGVAVEAVEETPGGLRLRLGDGDRLTAGQVVLAPGPWTAAAAWRDQLAPLAVRVKRVVALHVQLPPAPEDGVVVLHDEDAFLLPVHARGYWIFSYTRIEWDVDPDALTGGLTATDLHEGRELLARYAPRMAAHCNAGRVFCDAYSPDRVPLVRALDGDHRLIFAGAANGSGYRLAPAIAAAAADLLGR